MRALANKKPVIGEGPIWNENEQRLYTTNGMENEILIYDIYEKTVEIRKTPVSCAAICFSCDNKLIVSHSGGVGILEDDNSLAAIYDADKYSIKNANDMKVGPDGRIYVGTQSSKRMGLSNEVDGKLYSIDKYGRVTVLLDGIKLSNGLDWSPDRRLFYHTDSDTEIIKEYYFDEVSGEISPTGKAISLPGVDGFCVAENGDIYAACWGKGYIAVVNAVKLRVEKEIAVPTAIPASCAFAGKGMEYLAVTTALFYANGKDVNAGLTFLCDVGIKGKLPFRYEHT